MSTYYTVLYRSPRIEAAERLVKSSVGTHIPFGGEQGMSDGVANRARPAPRERLLISGLELNFELRAAMVDIPW